MFGDRAMYLEKFKTCARVRKFGQQNLGWEFYTKEHSKPLYTKQKILAFKNFYHYQICLEMFKLLTTKFPTSLHNLVVRSHRNNRTLLIVPTLPKNTLVYRGTISWNIAVKSLMNDKTFEDIQIGYFKFVLKKSLLELQSKHNPMDWVPHNFKFEKISKIPT